MDEAKQTLAFEKDEQVDVKEVLSKLLFLGPKIVLVTDGEHGSYFSDGQRFLKAPIYPAKIVEKTGAGDAYISAFITALILGESFEEAMIWGAINSSHVIQEIGAQNGLLSEEDLKRHRKAVPELAATS